jgi:dTDP-4-dehydrorhamnose 3,5-epimerase
MNIKIYKIKSNTIKKIIFSKFIDKRGSFQRIFCKRDLKKIRFNLKQINLAKNLKAKTFRGFHFQKKNKENKIITVLKGKIIFYAININIISKNYLKVFKTEMSEDSNFGLYIPKNFATAYFTLKPMTEIIYYMSNYYYSNDTNGINYKDPKIKIKLPYQPKLISEKDKNWKFL